MSELDQSICAIESRQVTAALESTGSSDPDVLFARKEELLARTREMNNAATTEILAGIAISVTIAGAFLGIPAIRRGLARRRSVAESVKTVEAAYCAYLMATAEKRKNMFKVRLF
ncbi:MAG TPA: hypothetical protein VEX68_26490 [Bryobacteraceae bacterium]|nr:hypothetical protein [Bryobacteraceae bacterium]